MFINQCFLDYYWLPRRGRTHKQARHLVSVVRSANTGPGNTGVSHAAPLSRGHVSRVTSSLLTQYFSAQYSGQRVTSRELLLICLLHSCQNSSRCFCFRAAQRGITDAKPTFDKISWLGLPGLNNLFYVSKTSLNCSLLQRLPKLLL